MEKLLPGSTCKHSHPLTVPKTPSAKESSRFLRPKLYHLGNAATVREYKITSLKLNTGFWKVPVQVRGSDFKLY